jgi:hypothetical protein
LLCAAGLAALAGSEVDGVLELCASAIEDTEAITTNDSDRKVDFNVMSYSSFFNLKLHHRCGRLRHPLRFTSTGFIHQQGLGWKSKEAVGRRLRTGHLAYRIAMTV